MLELTWATQVEISHFDWGFFLGENISQENAFSVRAGFSLWNVN